MAQTIKIKRSSANGTAGNSFNTPTSLENGELAYLKNNTHQKLYIGNPGGGTGDISVIGGKDFTDKLDLIGAANGSSTADARVVASSTNLGVVRVGSNLSIATTGVLSADNQVTSTSVGNAGALMESDVTNLAQVKAFDSSDYATAAQGTKADNALPKAGGTMTGNLVFGDNNKIQLGGTSTNLEIYNDGTTSYIQESATGSLIIKATDFEIHDGGGQTMVSFDADGSLRFYDQSAQNGLPVQRIGTSSVGVSINGQTNTTSLKFGNETVIVDSIKDEDDLNSDSASALATQQSIKKYVDDSVPTSVANATNASNAVVTEDQTTDALHYIGFYSNYSGTNAFKADRQLAWNPNDEILNIGTGGKLLGGDIQLTGSIKGPGTLYIDPAPDDLSEPGGSTTDTGEVVILGDLRVTGETTTVNSTTVSVGDNEIVLNAEHTGTPTLDAGIRVERGSLQDVFLNWNENNDEWVVNEGQSSSPYYYTILHSNNFATAYTGEIDGGTF